MVCVTAREETGEFCMRAEISRTAPGYEAAVFIVAIITALIGDDNKNGPDCRVCVEQPVEM